jgi:hypothetical protein
MISGIINTTQSENITSPQNNLDPQVQACTWFNKDDLGFRSTQTVRGMMWISEAKMMVMVMLM